MIEFSDLLTFKAVAKHLNFSKAATEIGLSASQVTKIIASLEDKIQTKLLYRTTRSVRLTNEGLLFLNNAIKTLNAMNETTHLFDRTQDPATMSGVVRITAPNTLGLRFLPQILKSYSKKFPNVQTQVLLADQYLDFSNDEIDLALRILVPMDSSLVARKLATNPISFYASPQYLEKHAAPQTIFDLKNHKIHCITPHLNCKFVKSKLSLKQLINPPTILCTNGDLLVEIGCIGDGILIRSEWGVAKEVKAGLLVPIPLDDHLESIADVYLVYPRHKFTPPRVKALIELIVKSNHWS